MEECDRTIFPIEHSPLQIFKREDRRLSCEIAKKCSSFGWKILV